MTTHPLQKRALTLEYLTIVWNVFEGIASVSVGLLTGSLALVAYGLESGIEVFASTVVVWDLKGASKKREKIALKLIGLSYLVVSFYIIADALISIWHNHHPDKSFIGILLMFLAAVVMISLGLLKHTVGQKMKSNTVLADAKFTLIDAALSLTVLIGLGLNLFFGWWWADQAMALVLGGIAFREGLNELL